MKTIATLLVAVVIAAGGVFLSRYADADDSPGGMVIGWVITLAGVVLAVRALTRREPSGR